MWLDTVHAPWGACFFVCIKKSIHSLVFCIKKCILLVSFYLEINFMNKLIFKHKEMELLYRDQGFHDRRLPPNLRRSYAKKCQILEATPSIKTLVSMKGLNFEPYEDHYSIRVNAWWRIEFDYNQAWEIIIFNIFDVNNHYKKNF